MVLAMTQLFPVNQNLSQQCIRPHPTPSVPGNLPYVLILVGRQTRLYIYIHVCVCVNVLVHIHIILHKLWVSRHPAYCLHHLHLLSCLKISKSGPSESIKIPWFRCLFHNGHGATRPWGTRQSSAALPSEASPEVPGVRVLAGDQPGEDWVFSWIL